MTLPSAPGDEVCGSRVYVPGDQVRSGGVYNLYRGTVAGGTDEYIPAPPRPGCITRMSRSAWMAAAM